MRARMSALSGCVVTRRTAGETIAAGPAEVSVFRPRS